MSTKYLKEGGKGGGGGGGKKQTNQRIFHMKRNTFLKNRGAG